MGVSFTIAAGPRQRSHSQARVPRDSWSQFTVSDSRLPHPGGPDPRIYIRQEQEAQLYPQALGSLFVAVLRWKYSNPPPHGIQNWLLGSVPGIQPRHKQHRIHRFQQFFHCCLCICSRGSVSTNRSLVTAVCSGSITLAWAHMSQYIGPRKELQTLRKYFLQTFLRHEI
jgi:hypothetical protein